MQIKGYLQTSVIEWPGKIASVIFTFGCNFRCGFCHNAGLVDPSTSLRLRSGRAFRMTRLQDYSEQSIIDDLEKRKKWVDALVVTGGEPCLQPDLPEFLSKVKELGLLTMIETNGSRPEILELLFKKKLLDRIAMDIKGPLDERYEEIIQNSKIPTSLKLRGAGKIQNEIKKSIEIILKSEVEYEFRTTVVPGIHNKKVLQEILGQLKVLCSNIEYPVSSISWKLQNFQPNNCLDPKFNNLKPFTEEEFEEMKKIGLLVS
ncbi:anaerobic ribonucleoside-triphosphate reductase activating protein [Candidatus Shapirobacteria bacterium CG08_land_8_20_14_0_20_39_18]|uniref:Anaerobic ribonucleoside-triphosphate reductase activating protein n=1 Tax=Candidatus Shapirobacteria bacterium CG08_land_8_20_14_0_20_39_18 TaxID=1974883 RepID=A0A2M6XDH7_9BACT|nr:MAG: anaerobic ribonucleoside-triphosphate reductase activating protein [Candidatus Shapirobacteria bacterium CG08_land_8_20_14_0_20_39_18]PIY64789.1 MAG: anaerobic ribonucleoside-triphosphate reductase activating protein [Candidatus Shapirobacteria bacterium CG_4_10_14_0_8_um_filter_39_15]PJE67916.1 MAG: anaerobic ribonucleoside-triphosphate reductase activating protein [Candidatus Shapirobacteria bacterium CG10_big_fil_rev_8_21_14_0_10_38_8]